MVPWLKRDLKAIEITVLVVVVLAVAFRAALPSFLKHEVNVRLSHIPEYTGHVDDVGVHVLHGGYSMRHFVIEKRTASGNEPFVAADDITFTIYYHDLLHGRFTSNVVITQGQINFEKSANPQASQNLGESTVGESPAAKPPGPPAPAKPWQDVVRDLFPVKITHLELIDSRIHYVDKVAQPKVDLAVDHLNLTANGLQNRPSKDAGAYPSVITANGDTIGRGQIHLVIRADPLAAQPHFDLRLALRNVSLPSLNPYLLQHANIDVGKGDLQVYTEVTASNGNYEGYVKPILTDLDFHSRTDRRKSPLDLIWKDIVAAITRLMRDKQHKQVATIVHFSGKFDQASGASTTGTVRNLIYNGFIQALRQGLEQNVQVTAKAPTS